MAKHKIILTRSEEEGASWGQVLTRSGHTVHYLPVQTYTALDPPVVHIAHFHMVLFTSKNAVAFFKAAFPHARQYHVSCAAVGRATARAAEEAGFKVDLVADQEKAEGLAREIGRRYPPKAKMLLPCSSIARDELPVTLGKAGYGVTVLPLYSPESLPRPEDLDALLAESTDLLFFAPSQVRAFFSWIADPPAHLAYWAIGSTTLKEMPPERTARALSQPTPGEFVRLLRPPALSL
jgi:uroporphyrinogen-III synthase